MQSVVDRTGIPADTIRSWERRHGFPAPARDAQNQRLYSEHDIDALQRLKEHTSRGVALRDALRLLPTASASQGEPPTSPEWPAPPRLHAVARLPSVDRLVDPLLAFDAAGARALLHTELATLPMETVAFSTILPAAERLRQEGGAGGAFGTAFLHRFLATLLNAADPDGAHARVVLLPTSGCDDPLLPLAHGIGLARRGYGVLTFGAEADVSMIPDIIARVRPRAVVLVAGDPVTSATAARWWSMLAELPSLASWVGTRAIAAPHQPSGADASILWLPPGVEAADILHLSIGDGVRRDHASEGER